MAVGLFEFGRGEILFGVFLFCVSGVLERVGGRRLLSLGKCSKQGRNHLFSRNEQLDLRETLRKE